MTKISLWLLPEKKIQTLYRPVINHWAKKLKTPCFEPHITILGEISGKKQNIIESCYQLTKTVKSIPITLSETTVSTTYFQCVFARVKLNLAILNLYRQFQKQFNYSPETLYMPHMSLVYGNLNLSQRLTIASKIKLPVKKFVADRVAVIITSSMNPKTWKKVIEFALKI